MQLNVGSPKQKRGLLEKLYHEKNPGKRRGTGR